ncbi:hypothetical protein CWB99_16660 [Pseudoalteromonas rubra]|uniref:Uncharacterized protein n=1 Tax=Pseudoalteromonas rubra TaxID=43658 RepID=A0A5S3WJH2_9GAMM|nr:hypothetical protein [Pseudoalteromonas rubra]TMP26933.1 hypothetical protein CWB99_16660 [Pseudoalteromonas rubra]TMP27651.1 hypothetical protein CWC00_22855 [Pseudoalteromonas rubra]
MSLIPSRQRKRLGSFNLGAFENVVKASQEVNIDATQLLELKYHARKHFVLLAGTDVQIPVSRSFIHTLKERITHQAKLKR